jgi:ATP-binding cassette subfamily B protein
VYSGIRVIKSYGKENNFIKLFSDESEILMDKSMNLAKVNAYFFPLMILLINMSTLIVLFVGGNQVAAGTIRPSAIAEFIIYVNMLTWPVTSIGWIASIVQEAEASQFRINELLKNKNNLIKGDYTPNEIKGNIKFNNVSYTYEQTGTQALKNVTFEIHSGQRVAFVGRTASGKSTIAELILRMYDINEGNIELDGKDIKTYNWQSLRKQIGYVPQDVFLFSDNVFNNIGFGLEQVDKEAVEQMAQNVAVKEDILRLSDGFDTIVGERGVTLSGGQKQRISIARALIKNPDLIILDDCLSAVDTETEYQILSYLDRALAGKTCIVITHRLTSLHDFDQIFYLEDGAIVEQGTHEELMANQQYYFDLYNMSLLEA